MAQQALSSSRHTIWRIALLAFILSAIFWLGGVTFRAVIGNDMLKSGTLEFKEYLAPEAEREMFRLLSIAGIVVICGYVAALVSGTVFLAATPLRFKENGWLAISAILLYGFVPVEAFTMYLDGKMIYQEFFTTADNTVFRELFIARVGALAGAPFVALLCYYTIIGLAVFQPMKKRHHPPQ